MSTFTPDAHIYRGPITAFLIFYPINNVIVSDAHIKHGQSFMAKNLSLQVSEYSVSYVCILVFLVFAMTSRHPTASAY